MSPQHAKPMVNLGGATARDILRLIQDARKGVRDKFGVRLKPEVVVLGKESALDRVRYT